MSSAWASIRESTVEAASIEDRILSLLDRSAAANEQYLGSTLRLLFLPYAGPMTVEELLVNPGQVVLAIATADTHAEPPAGAHVVPRKAMEGCSALDFWGAASIDFNAEPATRLKRLVCLLRGGEESANAASAFDSLARESGRLYQTLPSFVAPIQGTTSPRNLWASVLFGWLRSTDWVSKGDGFELVGLPFAASGELWRRLLYGTSADGRLQSAPAQSIQCGAPADGIPLGMATDLPIGQKKRFRVALSFPGERRPFVVEVANALAGKLGKDRVLYDRYYEAELARPNLDEHLQSLYHNESDLIAVFLCSEYDKKEWCGLEWRAIRDVIKCRRSDDVMPFRFDNTDIPGLFSIDGYIWIGDRGPSQVAALILDRLGA